MAEQARKSRRELAANVLASFSTGVTTIAFTNPMDTLKCRWQVAAGAGERTLRGAVACIAAEEGVWRGLWRPGLGPNMAAMGCAIGCRNGLYPTVRDTLGWTRSLAMPSAGPPEKVGPAGMFAAGLLAGMLGYLLASPLLQVKTQMQAEAGRLGADGRYETGARAGRPPSYRGGAHALRALSAQGGVRALWRGAGVIVARGAVLSASQLSAYDAVKTALRGDGLLGDGPALHATASLVAALCCTSCSMPLDVVLTVYQSAHSLGGDRLERYGRAGPLGCAAALLREGGPGALFRGWLPAFARLAPTCVFSFALYEQLRALFGLGFLD